MPRKARVESKTKIYHVMSRALNKQILFDNEKDYLKFLHIVKSAKSEIDFDLYGYCIMSNHYHLLIKDKSNKLSAIKFDNDEFLKWNELDNHDRCMEVMNNRLTDDDVTKLLYKYMNINTKKEYLQASEEEKVIAILNLIDYSIPLMQLSRVTGFYYNKLQKLRIGKDGNTVSLTYKR